MRGPGSRLAVASLARVALVVTVLAGPPGPPLPAAASGAPPPATLPVDQIRPGMRGVGRTVWEGTRIDTFDVTVIGVLRNFEPGRDMILARLGGREIERFGVVAGMSGSPVTIDGKLIGAVAAAWPFQKEPICGITPAVDLAELLARRQRSERQPDPGPAPAPPPARPGAPGAPGGSTAPPAPGTPAPRDGLPFGLRPLTTPLLMSGVPRATIERLMPRFESMGLLPVQAGGSGGGGVGGRSAIGAATAARDAYAPGAAVGAVLVSGDLAIDAIGTLAYRDGDRFVAFGHPFMGLGSCEIPMGPAEVHAVLPSQFISFKLASALAPDAVMLEDRPAGVVGQTGRQGASFPVEIDVTVADRQAPRPFRFRVAQAGILTPLILMTLADAAITATGRVAGEQSFTSRLTIELPGRPPLVTQDLFSTRGDHLGSVMEMLQPATQLLANRFERVDPVRVALAVESRESVREARIESVRLDAIEFERGEEMEIAVVLKPYAGDREHVRMRLSIPNDAAIGAAQLHVSDAAAARGRAQQRNPGRYAPASLGAQIALAREERRNNEVVAQLLLARDGVTYLDHELSRLPGSALAIVSSAALAGYRPLQSEVEARAPTQFVVSGGETIEINIKERRQP
jgi:hypothetical protein